MRKTADAQFRDASDQSLLISFGETIDHELRGLDVHGPDIHGNVVKLLRLLQAEPIEGIRNLHPAYSSLLIKFNPLKLDHAEVRARVSSYLARLEEGPLPTPREIEIPVCYGAEFGPDLDDVAAMHGITSGQAVELHCSARYIVYFFGFVPGFAYLGGLPNALASPRLGTPRTKVPQGSVGIGGKQTGVYPLETPGGWRLIGRTPLTVFRRDEGVAGERMNLLQIGDQVRFRPIAKEQFAEFVADARGK
jgi:KipI family sensor histidine kinase inhibitor